MGISKQEVFALYSDFEQRGLPSLILDGNPEAIRQAMALRRPNSYSFSEPKTEFESKTSDVQLMLWAVKKIGDPQRARQAFESVMKVLE